MFGNGDLNIDFLNPKSTTDSERLLYFLFHWLEFQVISKYIVSLYLVEDV